MPNFHCPLTIADALSQAALVAPDVEAVVADDGRVTYAELHARVGRVAAAMQAAGVRKGDFVAICMGNGVRWIELFFAAGTLGAVTVPVNTRLLPDEMAYQISQSRSRFLFIADRLLKVDLIDTLRRVCPGIDGTLPDPRLPHLERVVVCGADIPAAVIGWDAFMAGADGPVVPTCTPQDIFLIQYTSGTTGFPKGVMLAQGQMLANAWCVGKRIGLRIADRYHSARPFFHVAGTTLSILTALQQAATLVTMTRFEPGEVLRQLETERCSHLSANDTMILMLLGHPSLATTRLSLRGGYVVAVPAIIRRAIDELGLHEVVVAYGMSETSPNVALSCWWEPQDVRAAGRMLVQAGVELRCVDEAGRPVAAGEAGEIQVRGWPVMQGYLHKPEETAKTINAEGWLSTGDRGRLGADNRLEIMGRIKDIVRVGGENVAPAEVEDILQRHPKIRQAQIVGVPDERLKEVTAAFIVLREGETASVEEIVEWARANMAAYKVPRHLAFVPHFDDIGMTGSGKVQKNKLAAHARRLFGLETA